MANIKTLYGSDKLREAYPKVNENFNELNGDINVLRTRVNTIITTPIDGEAAAQELVDARDGEVTLGKRLDRDKQIVESHLAEITNKIENPEYSPEHTVIGGIGNMPDNVVEGYINDVVIEGLTNINSIKNGNFTHGTTEWKGSNTTLSVDSKTLQVSGDGSSNNPRAYQHVDFRVSRKYYMRANVRVKNANATIVRLYAEGGGMSAILQEIYSPVQDRVYTLQGVVTFEDKLPLALYISHEYSTAGVANGKVMEIIDVCMYDLTSVFGAGYEPTKEECDKLFPHWFDGAKSVTASLRIKSIGRNLFNLNDNFDTASNTEYYSEGNKFVAYTTVSATYRYVEKTYRLKPNTQYTLSISDAIREGSETGGYIDIYIGGAYVTSVSRTTKVKTFTSPSSGEVKLRFMATGASPAGVGKATFIDVQLEEGVIATVYEPYKESVQFIQSKDSEGNIVEIRSLPNGVRDEIDIKKRKLIKRVSNEVIINGSSNFSQGWFSDSIEGIYLCPILNWATNNNAVQNERNDVIATSNDGTYQNYGDYEPNKKCIYFKNGHLYLGIEKTKVDAIPGSSTYEKFINYLNQYPITLIYQLALPVEIPVTIDGVLQAFKNGMIYVEPYLKEEFAVTGTSITLPKAIASIDSIEILQNGEWQPTAGTLSTNGKTITVSAVGKYRVFGSIKAEESLLPQIIYEVPVNLKAQVNSNTQAITAMGKSVTDLNDKVDILLILNA